MALSDYRRCDVCDGKAFYDANLNYGVGDTPYRTAGNDQYATQDMLENGACRWTT